LLCLALALPACTRKQEDAKPIVAVAGPIQPPAPAEVSKNVLFWAVAGNLQQALQQAESLAAKAGPVPAGALSAGISQGLIGLGLKDTSVIDLGAPAGLMVLNPESAPEAVVAALTTKGEQAVLASVQPVWKPKPAQEGVFELAREVVEPYAVFQGKGAAAPGTRQQSLFVKFHGVTALVSPDRKVLLEAGPQLLERLQAGAPASGLTGMLRLDHVRESFAMQLAMLPQALKVQIAQGMQAQAAVVDPKIMEWILGWVVDKSFAFLNQTRSVGLALGFDAQAATLHVVLEPEPNSFFASFLAQQKPAGLQLAGGLPQDGFLGAAMNIQWGSLRKDMLDFGLEAIERVTGKPASDEVRRLLADWMELMGDELAVVESLDENGALQLIELIQVNDEARARSAMAALMKLANEMYSGPDGIMGIRATMEGPRSLGQHDGVDLQEMVLKMDFSSLPEVQAEMMRKVYGGEGFRMIIAVFDKTFALALGKTADAEVRSAIDRLRKKTAGLTAAAFFRDAAGGLEQGAGGFMVLSLSQFVTSTLRSTLAMTGVDQPDLKVAAPRSGMFIRVRSEQGRLVHTIRLPAAHLEELGQVIQQISGLSGGPAQ
jgi:hypothetical protein